MIINLSAKMSGSSSMVAKLSALFVKTGRTLSGEKSDIVDCPNGGFTPAEIEIIKGMTGEVKVLNAGEVLTLYRGQKIKSFEKVNKARLGPPESLKATAQRYNDQNIVVLYLSETLEGVKRELLPLQKDEKLWAMKFNVPLNNLKIANLCDVNTDLKDLMFRCELSYGEDEQPNGYPTQKFSRAIAKVIAEQYDGFQTFGVRGDRSLNYKNIILFNHKGWVDWCQESPFLLNT